MKSEETRNKKEKRKRARKRRFIFLLVIIFTWWFSNFTLKVTDVCFTDKRINDVITIVQITDLHGAVFGKGNKNLISEIEKQEPDLVFVTGDMYTNLTENSGRDTALELMKYLGEHFNVYYINGEHDSEDESFYREIEESGVNVLNYKDEVVRIKNTTLHLYGINNVYYSDTFNLKNAFVPDKNNYSVLLAHSSNFKKFADFGIDLSVCGDTHGGMFRLPYVGAVYYDGNLLPDRNGFYVKGTYTIGDSTLFVSSGLGAYPLPIRFFNRPEIVNIKLAPES